MFVKRNPPLKSGGCWRARIRRELDLTSWRTCTVKRKLDDYLSKGNDYQSNDGVENGVFCCRDVARFTTRGNVFEPAKDQHKDRDDADDYLKNLNCPLDGRIDGVVCACR